MGNFSTIFDKCNTKLKSLDYTFFYFIRNLAWFFFGFFSFFTLLVQTQDTKKVKMMKKIKLLRCPKAKRSQYGLRRKMNISEVSEFLILPYTQNRKLGNLGRMSLLSNSDSSYNSRFKNDKNMN